MPGMGLVDFLPAPVLQVVSQALFQVGYPFGQGARHHGRPVLAGGQQAPVVFGDHGNQPGLQPVHEHAQSPAIGVPRPVRQVFAQVVNQQVFQQRIPKSAVDGGLDSAGIHVSRPGQ